MNITYRNIIRCTLGVMVLACFALTFTSCSEKDSEDAEYADWQNRNDKYFSNLLQQARSAASSGSKEWKVIRNWSLDSTATADNDFIVVHVDQTGTGSGCPLYTDSVLVDYQGRLIPSSNHPTGYVFDQSWYGDDFIQESARPAHLLTSGVVDGFCTALQHMHIGDTWTVYMPYTLGYDTKDNSTSGIPAFSTLIFTIHLRAYYRPGTVMPNNQAKKGIWIEE